MVELQIHASCLMHVFVTLISFQCLEPACLGEETAVNRYNVAALLAEKSAAIGITSEEAREFERLCEDVVRIWTNQQDNGSMRCINRMSIRKINYHLKTTRTKFPDLRYANNESEDWFLYKNAC